jgi:2-methylcitrate dehydratase PrpD
MAAGFMSQFGTMAKPLHAGLAAKAGVLAASLARNGLAAGMDTFDGPTGMNRLMVGPDYEHLRDTLTHVEHGQNLRFETGNVGEPLLILTSGFRVKRFPNCGSAHRAMDGLLELRERHGFEAGDVSTIDVRAPVSHLNNLMYTSPADPLQAKFSLEYGLACILLNGRCALADFEPKRVDRPEVRALYPRIRRHPVAASEGEFPTEVEVKLHGGKTVKVAVAMPCGSLAAPFPTSVYWAKFEDCAGPVLPAVAREEARKALNGLPNLPKVATLMAPLRGPFAEERRLARERAGGA